MLINNLNSAVTFGKILVGQFDIQKKGFLGIVLQIPIDVWRLEPEDYSDYFQKSKVENLEFGRSFLLSNLRSDGNRNYMVTKQKDNDILGLANCFEAGDKLELDLIGTIKDNSYKGIGRSLLAGIIQDIKGKFNEMYVPYAIRSAQGFYKKCHFIRDDLSFSKYTLNEKSFDELIRDAKKQSKTF